MTAVHPTWFARSGPRMTYEQLYAFEDVACLYYRADEDGKRFKKWWDQEYPDTDIADAIDEFEIVDEYLNWLADQENLPLSMGYIVVGGYTGARDFVWNVWIIKCMNHGTAETAAQYLSRIRKHEHYAAEDGRRITTENVDELEAPVEYNAYRGKHDVRCKLCTPKPDEHPATWTVVGRGHPYEEDSILLEHFTEKHPKELKEISEAQKKYVETLEKYGFPDIQIEEFGSQGPDKIYASIHPAHKKAKAKKQSSTYKLWDDDWNTARREGLSRREAIEEGIELLMNDEFEDSDETEEEHDKEVARIYRMSLDEKEEYLRGFGFRIVEEDGDSYAANGMPEDEGEDDGACDCGYCEKCQSKQLWGRDFPVFMIMAGIFGSIAIYYGLKNRKEEQ